MFDRRINWPRLLFLMVLSIVGAMAAGGLVLVAGAKVLSLDVWIAAALAVTIVLADAWVQLVSDGRSRLAHMFERREVPWDLHPRFRDPQTHFVNTVGRAHWARVRRWRFERGMVLSLLLLAAIGYIVAYQGARSVLGSSRPLHFSPSETVQVITAISGLVTAVGLTFAAILKAFAQLVDARANMVRAKAGLPPESESLSIENDKYRTTDEDVDWL